MKRLLLVLMLLPATFAWADGSGSGSGSGSATPVAGCQDPTHVDPFDKRPVCAATPPAPVVAADAKDLRKTCTAAMNADPTFSADIVKAADKIAAEKRDADTLAMHQASADQVAMNEKHVILAYGAMWLVAAAFVLFLWRRQVALRAEIVSLRAELTRTIEADKKS